jgi:hypothetical protein
MNDQTKAPDPDYSTFNGEAEFQAAVERLLAQPGRELRVFDPDLAALRVNEPARIAQLEAFLRGSRTRRLFIVLHDTDHLSRRCPRMMDLLKRFGHAIQIHRTHDEIRGLQDAFLVLDAAHYVRRPVATFFRGAIGLHDDTEALGMRSRFHEIWSASYPGVSSTPAGL